MSARHVHRHTTSRTVLMRSMSDPIREPGPFEGFGRALMACTDTVDEQTLRREMFTPDWLGLNLDTVVVLRYVVDLSVDYQGSRDDILALARSCLIRRTTKESMRMAFENDVRYKPIISLHQDMQPMYIAPTLRSRFLYSGSGDILWARHEVLDGSELFSIAHPIEIVIAIRKMLVAQPYPHPYRHRYCNIRHIRAGLSKHVFWTNAASTLIMYD